MAKRKYNMKARKTDPAVMTLQFDLSTVSGGTEYICLSQCASLVNRRFYRQGINWVVSGFKFVVGPNSGTIGISKLQQNWTMSQGWKKAFSLWNNQQRDAIEEAGAESAVARFRDFKIFADPDHVQKFIDSGLDLNVTNMLPSVGTLGSISTAAGGEWDPSQIVVPNILPDGSGSLVDPIEYYLHMHGINNYIGRSRGIVEGYADSRAYPQSPDPAAPIIASSQNWMRQMFDVGNSNVEVTENATENNDELPYPQVNYPGGETQLNLMELHDASGVSGTTIGGTTLIRGGTFPCGLIRMDWSGDSALDGIMLINLVPGNHRGYLCEKMQEM
jgi:hypothetical protein